MTEDSLTTEALLARRALAEKATPGPWEKDGSCVYTTWSREEYPERGDYVDVPGFAEIRVAETANCIEDEEIKANAAHIAANSPDVVMQDIDEIIRLRAEVEALKKRAAWLAEKLSCVCNCTGYSTCGIPDACPHDRGVACVDVEDADWLEVTHARESAIRDLDAVRPS